MDQLDKLNEVAISLKFEDLTMSRARDVFDSNLETYPMLASRLNSRARIVNNPHFEAGNLKLKNKQAETLLSETEKVSVQPLLGGPQSVPAKSVRHDFIFERASKKINVKVIWRLGI